MARITYKNGKIIKFRDVTLALINDIFNRQFSGITTPTKVVEDGVEKIILPEQYDAIEWLDPKTPLLYLNEIQQKLNKFNLEYTWSKPVGSPQHGPHESILHVKLGQYSHQSLSYRPYKKKKHADHSAALDFINYPPPWLVDCLEGKIKPEDIDYETYQGEDANYEDEIVKNLMNSIYEDSAEEYYDETFYNSTSTHLDQNIMKKSLPREMSWENFELLENSDELYDGIVKKTLIKGKGFPDYGAELNIDYVTMLEDGTVVQSSLVNNRSVNLCLGEYGDYELPYALDLTISKMEIGETSFVYSPYEYAFGEQGAYPDIPSRTNILFWARINSSKSFYVKEDDLVHTRCISKKLSISKKMLEDGVHFFEQGQYKLAMNLFEIGKRQFPYSKPSRIPNHLSDDKEEICHLLGAHTCYMGLSKFFFGHEFYMKDILKDANNSLNYLGVHSAILLNLFTFVYTYKEEFKLAKEFYLKLQDYPNRDKQLTKKCQTYYKKQLDKYKIRRNNLWSSNHLEQPS
eukprot:TRINITY_DN5525_c0_g1_i2.p1 TRINITY_DN5525_c0_g1~~TRINITY_DN5525_c0_g1_i2.p1  ORF type:complete len:517 (-),score=110.56 TRINITY_DN5525_c0_g1_i2:54-1604(-)